MSATLRIVIESYAGLMRLFPQAFQTEFGEEQIGVFAATVRDAATKGWRALSVVCLRELRDLPGSLVCQYRQQFWRKVLLMKEILFSRKSLRSAVWGALGLGFVFALLGFAVAGLRTEARLMLSFEINYPLSVFLEAVAFALAGGVSGAVLSRGDRKRMVSSTWAGGIGCSLAYALIFILRQLPFQQPGLETLFSVVQYSVLAVVGFIIGIVFGGAQRNIRLALRLALAGAVGFGVAGVVNLSILEPAFYGPLHSPCIGIWIFFLHGVIYYAIMGILGGAALGLVVLQNKPHTVLQAV